MKKASVVISKQVNILGVGVHAVDMQEATAILERSVRRRTKNYVCLAGVHGIMEAQRDAKLKSILAKALLVAPDGMPTIWIGRLRGFHTMRRVFGPDLMVEVIRGLGFRNCSHFFCGGGPGVAESLRDEMLGRFPWVKVVGTYSPPFRAMTASEETEFVAKVNATKPDIIWVGLSTPKQERFMAHYLPILDTHLMVGVGAAFLFHTGAIRDSPKWVKCLGLQWLHRLIQEPTRLWRRYLFNNPSFVVCVFLQLIGWKRYPLEPGPRL